MQREGLVSTIIPVFNRAAMLREAVMSVIAQIYRPIEIIIVDDGSTDDTPAMIAALVSEHPDIIRPLKIANGGPGGAREAGRIVAEGEYIQYLDSDDLLLPQKFAQQVEGLRGNAQCGASYGMTRLYKTGQSPQDVPWKRTGEHLSGMFPAFLQSRWWDTSTPLYRRVVTDAAGPWSTLRVEEDWEYDCRIAAQGVQLHRCMGFVSDTRVHDGPMLSANGRSPANLKDRAEAHRLILNHATNACISPDTPEMQHFARELFLLARQCGAAGLSKEARMLFELSRDASESTRARGFDFKAYSALAAVLGWSMAGRLALALDRVRK